MVYWSNIHTPAAMNRRLTCIENPAAHQATAPMSCPDAVSPPLAQKAGRLLSMSAAMRLATNRRILLIGHSVALGAS